jgi:hypothetical protein
VARKLTFFVCRDTCLMMLEAYINSNTMCFTDLSKLNVVEFEWLEIKLKLIFATALKIDAQYANGEK